MATLARHTHERNSLNETADRDLANIQDFYAKIMAVRCRECHASVARDLDPRRHLADWSNALAAGDDSDSTVSICAAPCPRMGCRAVTCLGCEKEPTVGVNTERTDAGHLDWCCDRGRLFAIWVFLTRYDQVELKMQEMESHNKKTKHDTALLKGMYGSTSRHRKQNKGVGYVSNSGFDDVATMFDEANMYGTLAVRAINFQSADTLTDGVLGQLLTLIAHLLPSRHDRPSSAFDKSPPSCLMSALRLGLLIDKMGQLLRNDSIADISKRASVYFPALDFVDVLGSHEATRDLVTGERYYKRGTSGLQMLSSGGAVDPKGKGKAASAGQMLVLGGAEDGNAAPLVSRLDNLVKQSRIMLGLGRGAEGRREMRSDADRVSLQLCKTIVMVHSRVDPGVETHKEDLGLSTVDTKSDGETAKAWTAFHQEACFELTEAAMEQNQLLGCVPTSHSPKGRIPYLMKEMASMATSLPEGIFVKASSETPGVMKCLVVGPSDTPYENGLFPFDLAAGPRYPDEPPIVVFRGTNGGIADMNPNLHRDGTVCLSLLGTFDGPAEAKWQARRSTILSVLVSIQGMILTSEPWRNHPGNGDATGAYAHAACRQYSLDRMALTVRYALLPWLLDSSWRKDSIWHDVARRHFILHRHRILHRVRAWARVSPGIESFREPTDLRHGVVTYTPVGGRNLLRLLEKALAGLEKTK